MTTRKIIYCKKNHDHQGHHFIKNQKYILEIYNDNIYTILKIFDLDDNFLVTVFGNNKIYNINRKTNKYFITESQLRLKKLKNLNKIQNDR